MSYMLLSCGCLDAELTLQAFEFVFQPAIISRQYCIHAVKVQKEREEALYVKIEGLGKVRSFGAICRNCS